MKNSYSKKYFTWIRTEQNMIKVFLIEFEFIFIEGIFFNTCTERAILFAI